MRLRLLGLEKVLSMEKREGRWVMMARREMRARRQT